MLCSTQCSQQCARHETNAAPADKDRYVKPMSPTSLAGNNMQPEGAQQNANDDTNRLKDSCPIDTDEKVSYKPWYVRKLNKLV